ncbi:hypothetical protein BaRGS_00023600 [Batillaria attramentaria]|uniref:Uncharacterized protein n=1 Tax=Batillaria attramentaria TaxID=370345 RepID=A0ABD0KDI6_9CAEN
MAALCYLSSRKPVLPPLLHHHRRNHNLVSASQQYAFSRYNDQLFSGNSVASHVDTAPHHETGKRTSTWDVPDQDRDCKKESHCLLVQGSTAVLSYKWNSPFPRHPVFSVLLNQFCIDCLNPRIVQIVLIAHGA